MTHSLTDTLLRKLPTPSSGRLEIWDQRIPGFGVRISSTGTKTFILVYRHRGRPRRLSLGRYPFMSLSDARDKATEALQSVSKGSDPSLEVADNKSNRHQFDQALEDFLKRHCKARNKPGTAKETERLLRRHFRSAWGRRDLRDITQQHVTAVIDALVTSNSPSEANHALTALKTMFSWCMERQLLTINPITHLKKPARVTSRSRVLSPAELSAVWNSTSLLGYPFGSMTQLLILTAQRRGEVTQMCWSHIDQTEKTWTIPAEFTKNGREHTVPLSDAALDVLRTLPKLSDTRVFPARGNADNAISGFSRAKTRLDTISGANDWTIHDLRRTAATGMAELGIAPHVVERILNHVSGSFGGVAGIYNRFKYLPEMREALDAWARQVVALPLPTKREA